MTRNTRDNIGKESSSHITKNISVARNDEALAHAIFTSDVDMIVLTKSMRSDSGAMKLIAVITRIYLPRTFVVVSGWSISYFPNVTWQLK